MRPLSIYTLCDQGHLHTSDLGTSDFSSSELWPPSTSSSPFEYAPRYRGGVSDRSGFNTDSRDNRLNTQQGSFLNLQSSMQFSYLKRVRGKTGKMIRMPYLISSSALHASIQSKHRLMPVLIDLIELGSVRVTCV